MPQPLIEEGERLLDLLHDHPGLDPDGLTHTFTELSRRDFSARARGPLAELEHAHRRLATGAVEPGTRAIMAAENFAIQNKTPKVIEFAPGDHFVFGGAGLPPEADLLFRGVDGYIHLDEVKANAHALLEAVHKAMFPDKPGKPSRKYLMELQKFGSQPRQKATIALASGDQFWEMMFTVVDPAGPKTLGDLLISISYRVDFLVEGRHLRSTELRAALDRVDDLISQRPSGLSQVEFLRATLPKFSSPGALQ